jgi:hypothetical protein
MGFEIFQIGEKREYDGFSLIFNIYHISNLYFHLREIAFDISYLSVGVLRAIL